MNSLVGIHRGRQGVSHECQRLERLRQRLGLKAGNLFELKRPVDEHMNRAPLACAGIQQTLTGS